jgi:hypothetical protein
MITARPGILDFCSDIMEPTQGKKTLTVMYGIPRTGEFWELKLQFRDRLAPEIAKDGDLS